MTRKPSPQRDQLAYELYNKYAVDVLAAVKELYSPYALMPYVSGVRGCPPKAMAVIVATVRNRLRTL